MAVPKRRMSRSNIAAFGIFLSTEAKRAYCTDHLFFQRVKGCGRQPIRTFLPQALADLDTVRCERPEIFRPWRQQRPF